MPAQHQSSPSLQGCLENCVQRCSVALGAPDGWSERYSSAAAIVLLRGLESTMRIVTNCTRIWRDFAIWLTVLVPKVRAVPVDLGDGKTSAIEDSFAASRDFARGVAAFPKAILFEVLRWIKSTLTNIASSIMTNFKWAFWELLHLAEVAILKTLEVVAMVVFALCMLVLLCWILKRVCLRARHELRLWKQRREERRRVERMERQVKERRREEEERKQKAEVRRREEAKAREESRRQEETRRQEGARKQEERRREQKERAERAERQRKESDRKTSMHWLAHCEVLLSHVETLTLFPDPPFRPCTEATPCLDNTILRACPHSMKKLYQASGRQYKELVQIERRRWHPDRFAKCPMESREEVQRKATELFKIVDRLSKEC